MRTITKEAVIKKALEIIGVLGEGEDPNVDQIDSSAVLFDMLVSAWQTEGINIWAVDEVEVPLVVDQRSYTLGPDGDVDLSYRPVRVVDGFHRNSEGYDVPLNIWSREEYYRLSDKESGGRPLNLYFDRRATESVIYIWQTPKEEDEKLILALQRSLDTVDLEEDVDFPSEYFLALTYNLAFLLCNEYGVSSQKWNMISNMAQMFKMDAEGYNREDTSFFLEPDPYSYRHG